jgi:hypothetical protein
LLDAVDGPVLDSFFKKLHAVFTKQKVIKMNKIVTTENTFLDPAGDVQEFSGHK